jgi:hypothetical protein
MATISDPEPEERSQSQAGAATADGAAHDANHAQGSSSPLDELGVQLNEFIAYAVHYYSAQRDLAEWRLTRFVLRGAGFAIIGLACLAAAATAVVLLLLGAAHGLGAALGDRAWAGELIVGLGVFLALAVGLGIVSGQTRRAWRKRIDEKYARNQERQRAVFGHDARETAKERGPG